MGVSERDVWLGFVAVANKGKRFVILNVSGDRYQYLLINSNMTDYQLRNSKIGKFQLPLLQEGRESYLDWDSFLSCENVHEGSLKDLNWRISSGEIKRLGVMAKKDFEMARALIYQGGLYSLEQLEDFGIYEEDFD